VAKDHQGPTRTVEHTPMVVSTFGLFGHLDPFGRVVGPVSLASLASLVSLA
jgi:hypothetical protein